MDQAWAGTPDFRFHDEAFSRFFEMGLSVPEVALISGHKDVRMLMRYTHLGAETVRTALSNSGSDTPCTRARGARSLMLGIHGDHKFLIFHNLHLRAD